MIPAFAGAGICGIMFQSAKSIMRVSSSNINVHRLSLPGG
jgi:hypothetical protein